MKKLGEGGQFEPAWSHYLCEYMMTQQTPVVRRQVRKLLLFICGHKDRYRQMRDMHALDYHIKVSMGNKYHSTHTHKCINNRGHLTYCIQYLHLQALSRFRILNDDIACVVQDVKVLCAQGGFSFSGSTSVTPINLPYDSLIQLIEHLKSCVDIASSRTPNWQK